VATAVLTPTGWLDASDKSVLIQVVVSALHPKHMKYVSTAESNERQIGRPSR
jgi:hypothetical protein